MVPTGRGPDTRTRILDAAERLIAEAGIDAASMRAVTSAAKVNLAAVNYHFGSKESLVVAVYARRLRPLNEERLRGLDAAEAAAIPAPPALEAVLRSLIEPTLRQVHATGADGQIVIRLLGRCLNEQGSWLRELLATEMDPLIARYTTALGRCLPELPQVELYWRIHFAAGAMTYTLSQGHKLEHMSKGACDLGDVEGTTRRLVQFIAAGMRA